MSLEQFACLVAELRSQPGREANVLTKYGLDAPSYEQTTKRFEADFVANPDQAERFQSLSEYYTRTMQRR